MSSGHFDLVKNFGYNLIRSDVIGFGFVGQTDTVTEDVMAHGTHVFRNDMSAAAQESIGSCSFGQTDRGSR